MSFAIMLALGVMLTVLGVLRHSGTALALGTLAATMGWSTVVQDSEFTGGVLSGAIVLGLGVVAVAVFAANHERQRHGSAPIVVERRVRAMRRAWLAFDLAVAALVAIIVASVADGSGYPVGAAFVGGAAVIAVMVVVYSMADSTT